MHVKRATKECNEGGGHADGVGRIHSAWRGITPMA
jgi:hypothetical protein